MLYLTILYMFLTVVELILLTFRVSCDDLKAREEFKSALKKPEELDLLTAHFFSLK